MANATLTTIPATAARTCDFHAEKSRQDVLDHARAMHTRWTELYDQATQPFWKAAIARGEARPSYRASLKKVLSWEIDRGQFLAACAAERAAREAATLTATPADKIRNAIHCLEMADRHTAENRAEVKRLEAELAALETPAAIAA